MSASDFNSSSAHSFYYYMECDNFYDGVSQDGGTATGLLVLFATYFLELLIGAPPNVWLFHHILKKRSKAGGILPADFLPFHVVLTQMFFYLTPPLTIVNHFYWKSQSVMDVTTMLNSMVLIVKPLLLCLVSVEWYIAVVRPLDYIRTTKRCYRWGGVFAIWCIYIGLVVEAIHKHEVYLITLVQFPVLLLDTFCCVSILRALRKPPPGDRRNPEGEEKETRAPNEKPKVRREMNSMKRKAFITIAVIQTVLTLNYLPFIVVVPLNSLISPRDMKCQFVPLALSAAASCSYLQPLLYLFRLGRLPCASQRHGHKAS